MAHVYMAIDFGLYGWKRLSWQKTSFKFLCLTWFDKMYGNNRLALSQHGDGRCPEASVGCSNLAIGACGEWRQVRRQFVAFDFDRGKAPAAVCPQTIGPRVGQFSGDHRRRASRPFAGKAFC